MPFQFHVLASGSSGNACALEADGFGVLIDFGLSPRQLAPRMRRCGIGWNRIHAVLLTHPHSDHWKPTTLAHLAKLGLPIYCHPEHREYFNSASRAFRSLADAKLFRDYEPGTAIELNARCQCLPIDVPHDGGVTCGFRFDGAGWALGYAADLGSWKPALAKRFANVDLLALEFNHDVEMQLQSGRHPMLIRRCLGDHGHLSNEQAANLLIEIVKRSEPGRLRYLVQLHLSRDCNRPELAQRVAKSALAKVGVELPILTAHQDQPGTTVDMRKAASGARQVKRLMQPMLQFAE